MWLPDDVPQHPLAVLPVVVDDLYRLPLQQRQGLLALEWPVQLRGVELVHGDHLFRLGVRVRRLPRLRPPGARLLAAWRATAGASLLVSDAGARLGAAYGVRAISMLGGLDGANASRPPHGAALAVQVGPLMACEPEATKAVAAPLPVEAFMRRVRCPRGGGRGRRSAAAGWRLSHRLPAGARQVEGLALGRPLVVDLHAIALHAQQLAQASVKLAGVQQLREQALRAEHIQVEADDELRGAKAHLHAQWGCSGGTQR
mmetsp:Transcript_17808/g.53599  ORF Transcript_17808/g.53599 Transcript_17808/m.53599 type:complete len:258 (-) Transcript_17808:275-1048(-)